MKDRLTELEEIKRQKRKVYTNTPFDSWKKKLYRYELELIDGRIKIERLKRQYK